MAPRQVQGVLRPTQRLVHWVSHHRELLVYGLLIALALSLRLWDLGSRTLHHDESLHAFFSWKLAEGMGYQQDALMHGPFQFHATAAVFTLFGDSNTTARLLPALFGTALVGLPYLFRGLLGRAGALLVAVALALSPTMLYFSRFARNDIYMAVWTLGLVIVTWRYIQEGRSRYLYMTAALLALAFATKETAFIVAALLGGFFFILAMRDVVAWVRGRRRLSEFSRPGVLLILLVTLTLPLWSAATGLVQGRLGVVLANDDPAAGPLGVPLGVERAEQGIISADLLAAGAIVVALLAVAIVVGTWWDRRKWLLSAGIFFGIWVLLYTTLFTNTIEGIGSGVWQSLGYWVVQQDVARGNQPWYYYFVIGFNYEFLPFTFAVIGAVYYLIKGDRFTRFLVYWAALTFLAYTLAGEKMPWLLVNVALPLIVLGGKFLGDVVGRVSWRRAATWNGALLLAMVPAAVVFSVGSVVAVVQSPDFFQGPSFWTFLVLALSLAGIGLTLLRRLPRQYGVALAMVGVALVMGYGTVNASLRASYRNGDVPTEMLVYTQSAPDIQGVLTRIDLLAEERGMAREDLSIIVDAADGFSWPWAWYLRNFDHVSFPNLAEEPFTEPPNADVVLLNGRSVSANQQFLSGYPEVTQYKHRWWLPESYRNLSPRRIGSALTRRSGWRGPLEYFLFRQLDSELGFIDAEAYIRSGAPASPSQAAGASGRPIALATPRS